MFKLKSVTINKYKSYTEEQTVNIEPDITTLVGKNESGKTAFLEALAKSNYFTEDENFKFDEVHDFPRNELKKHQRSGEEPEVIVCTYEIDDQTFKDIESDLCEGVLSKKQFSVATKYKGGRTWQYVDLNELRNFRCRYFGLHSPSTSPVNVFSRAFKKALKARFSRSALYFSYRIFL